MNVRTNINQHSYMAIGFAIGATVVALVAIFFWNAGQAPKPAELIKQLYFTTDDGQTWFADDVNRIYPFERDGKEAVRVHVYKCGDNGKPFAAFLEKMNEKALDRVKDATDKAGGTLMPEQRDRLTHMGRMVKKSGDAEWVELDSEAGNTVMEPKCPEGNVGTTQPVFP